MSDLSNSVALVTGAGRGIGRAIALRLASMGVRVALTARTEDQLLGTANEIRSAGGSATAIAADLALDADLERVVNTAREFFGAVDYLINNAGWGKRSSVVRMDVRDLDQTLRLNLRAPMLLARALLPGMIERRSGAVINIGSMSGKSGEANGAAYSATKFGLIGFTQSLYEEVREYGIKVAVILPGFVDTPLIPPNRKLDRSKMIQPEDVAQAVEFILTTPITTCPVEITLRPQRSPYR